METIQARDATNHVSPPVDYSSIHDDFSDKVSFFLLQTALNLQFSPSGVCLETSP